MLESDGLLCTDELLGGHDSDEKQDFGQRVLQHLEVCEPLFRRDMLDVKQVYVLHVGFVRHLVSQS